MTPITSKVHGPYDPPVDPGLTCTEKSLTRQSEADACDINLIMKRFEKTAELPAFTDPGVFADVTTIGDYRAVQDRILRTRTVFDNLPLDLRQRFEMDPINLLDFLADPANHEEAVQLGLFPNPEPDLEKPPEPTPTPSPTGDAKPPQGA